MSSLSCRLLFTLATLASALPASAQTRIYLLDERNLSVMDGTTFQRLAGVDLLSYGNPSGIAITGNGSRAYVGLGRIQFGSIPGSPLGAQPRVAVIDLITLTVLRTVAVGANPIDLIASPSGDRVYVANNGERSVSVIRTSDDTVVATIPLSVNPKVLAVSNDGAQLYAAGSQTGGSTPTAIAVSTTTFAVGRSYVAPGCPDGLAVSPDGSRLYVAGECASPSVFAYDTATGARTAAVATPAVNGGQSASGLVVTADGARLIVGSKLSNSTVWDTATMTQIATLTPSSSYVALDPSGMRAFTWGFSPGFTPHGTTQLDTIDLTSYTATKVVDSGQTTATGLAVAPVSPCGQFIATPSYSAVTIAGGAGSFSAPVPAGCPWSVTSTDAWLTITSATSGTGPATITYSAAPSTGPRTAELRINGQALPIYQTQPLVMIDTPTAGSHVRQGFNLGGWVGELAVGGPASAPLVNHPLIVHVWAYSASGGAPTFVGQGSSAVRPDVAAVFPGYVTGGFNVTVSGLVPGVYTFVAYLFSPYLNTFAAARTVTVTIDSSAFTVIDTLPPNASVTTPFRLGGWALDASAATGTGVDLIHVYAYPDSGAAPTFMGFAAYGLGRGDLIPYFGTRFVTSGYAFAVDGLTPGGYTMVAYAHSTVTGRFEPAVVHVTVTGAAEPLEIETLAAGADRAVSASGWAIDRRASSGTGVAAIHVWAYPDGGGPPVFLGSAQLGFFRADIAAMYGQRYGDAGWTLTGTLPSGRYQVVFYALSAATGQFDNVRVRPLIVP